MSTTITVQVRVAGQQRSLLDDWSIPSPPDISDGGEPLTLRSVITHIVLAEVRAFRQRQSEQRFLRVLTQRQIQEGAAKGRILSGQTDMPPQPVDQAQAVATALQAFEDQLYLVAIDDQLQRSLDGEVFLKPDSKVTFIRLTMLAGGF